MSSLKLELVLAKWIGWLPDHSFSCLINLRSRLTGTHFRWSNTKQAGLESRSIVSKEVARIWRTGRQLSAVRHSGAKWGTNRRWKVYTDFFKRVSRYFVHLIVPYVCRIPTDTFCYYKYNLIFSKVNHTNISWHCVVRHRDLFEKLIVGRLVKFPTFYGSQMFITIFIITSHRSVFWARLIQLLTVQGYELLVWPRNFLLPPPYCCNFQVFHHFFAPTLGQETIRGGLYLLFTTWLVCIV
jgi:hypothetical protein